MFNKTFRRLAGRSVIALGALVLVSCAQGAPDSPPAIDDNPTSWGALNVQLSFIKNTQNSGEYMADINGYYAEEGFSPVTLIAGPTAVEAAVASGSVDVSFSTVIGSASAIMTEGMPLKIIGALHPRNAFTVMSLAGENAINAPTDLAGKRIGVTAGTAQLIVEALVKANGVDPSTITFVPADSNALLVSGEVDAYFGFETNDLILLQQAGHDVVSLPLASNGLPVSGTIFAVTEESIANDRDKLKSFLRAEIRGWKDAIANPESGARLALDNYGADLGLIEAKELAQAEKQLNNIITEQTRKTGLFLLSKTQMDENVAALALVGIDISAEKLFDMSLLEEIYAESPELVQLP